MAEHNKQSEVTAASLLRRAKEYRTFAKSHRGVARDKQIGPQESAIHRSVAIAHDESALILREEAKKLRAMR